ncbi:MAG: quinoprotein dehydrogenase-associated SoxYZ-like carrier, partial [Pseudomonadota bacterium]
MMIRAAAVALLVCVSSGLPAKASDPLNSGNWDWVKGYLFKDAQTVFDDRVIVRAPKHAEDNMNVPFVVDARALDDVQKIVVFA